MDLSAVQSKSLSLLNTSYAWRALDSYCFDRPPHINISRDCIQKNIVSIVLFVITLKISPFLVESNSPLFPYQQIAVSKLTEEFHLEGRAGTRFVLGF